MTDSGASELRGKALAKFRKLFRKNGITARWLGELRSAVAECESQAGELADCKERYLAATRKMDDAVVELYRSVSHLELLGDKELDGMMKEAAMLCHLAAKFHDMDGHNLDSLGIEANRFGRVVEEIADGVSARPTSFEDVGIEG